MTAWTVIPDFDHLSLYGGKCPVTGGIKKPGDPGVLRGPDIDTYGLLDISWDAAVAMVETIGGAGPDEKQKLTDALAQERATNAGLRQRLEELEELFAKVRKAMGTK